MNPATLLARLTADALAAAGVSHVLLCPGSRSAPLAYELQRRQRPYAGGGPPAAVLHVRHDERVAGFTALGVAKAGPGTGAVVTTSGTAAANLHPAVLEAHHANVPLVVVTADRPTALRGTWANQTSDQQAGLFAAAVRGRLDLADADAAADPDDARGRLDRVLALATGGPGRRPGPVHLNLGFSEPLLPDDGPDHAMTPRGDATSGRDLPRVAPAAHAEPAGTVAELGPAPRTVVLAGDGAGPAAAELAERAGWPLLAEPSSGARFGPNAVGPYRLLLELADLGGRVQRVVAFGRPTLSRQVTGLLGRRDVEVVLVSPYPDWPDPGRAVVRTIHPPRLVGGSPGGRRDWLDGWLAAGCAASQALDAVLDTGGWTGPLVAREVAAAIRPGEILVAAASNPIRDLDLAAAPGRGGAAGTATVLANRGLSGIDGTVSTAIGAALGGARVRALVGDLAFLHDLNALLAGPGELRPDLQVVVLNDDGGGIFSLLEQGQRAEAGSRAHAVFERVFATPHGADLAALCGGYRVPHVLPGDPAELAMLLARPPAGLSVVEVRASRSGLRELHARIRASVHDAAVRALTAAPLTSG